MNSSHITKIPTELLYRAERRWTRFPNTDSAFIQENPRFAVVYHSGLIFRVMTVALVHDLKVDYRNQYLKDVKTLHRFLRNLNISSAQLYSTDPVLIEYINGRTEEKKSTEEYLEKLARPNIGAYHNPSVGGLRQLENLASLAESSEIFLLEKQSFGIDWRFYSSKN